MAVRRAGPAIGSTEGIGVVVAMVVLLITFGSIVAAGLPMLTALIGVGTGMAGILWASSVIEMSNTAPILALMLGLAVGIDYALFIVSRHRSQVKAGMPIEESIARATGTAGTAVVFAGLDRADRAGRAVRRRYPVPDRDGSGRGRHGGDLGAHRDHPAAGAARASPVRRCCGRRTGPAPPRCGPSRPGRTA